MDRASILAVLGARRPEFASRFGVRAISLFGSAARDQLRPDSDVDILVEFDAPPTFERYFGLKDALQAALAREVDLVTPNSLKSRVRAGIESEIVRVA